MDFTQLQAEHKQWCGRNFPNQKAHHCLLGMIEELGELSHAQLKMEQGIRVNEDHVAVRKDSIADLALYLIGFCNFYGVSLGIATLPEFPWDVQSILLSMPRQVHKVCISNDDNRRVHAINLLNDLSILSFNIDVNFEQNLLDTWEQVKQRNWTKNKETGI